MSTSRFMLAMLAVAAIMTFLGAMWGSDPMPEPTPVSTSMAVAELAFEDVIPYIAPEYIEEIDEDDPVVEVNARDAELIAQALYGEYRGPDKLQQAAVVWCILNRCDYLDDDIETIVTAPNQFHGYSPYNPVMPNLYDMVVDVMTRWHLEHLGQEDVGRVLPKDYMWFTGNGTVNTYRNCFTGGDVWDWSLPNPYEE